MEAQVQLDETGHRLDGVLVETHRLHPAHGHLGTDDLVMMEAHATRSVAVLETARGGLADVMHERGKAQNQVRSRHGRGRPFSRSLQGDRLLEHNQRVLVDVLVSVSYTHLELKCRQLGQDVVGQACLDEEPESCLLYTSPSPRDRQK